MVLDLLLPGCRLYAALRIGLIGIVGLVAAHAHAQSQAPSRAVLDPLPGVQVSYERLGPEGSASPPGRLEGSLATPVGTLRTTVHAAPLAEQQLQLGDTSFDVESRVFGGQLQVRGLHAGGTVATWRGRLGADSTAETDYEWTPVRSGQALRWNHNFGAGVAAAARLSISKTAAGQGSRGEFEVMQDIGRARWNAGIDAPEQSYVGPGGAGEAGVGVLVGAQWLILPHTRFETLYKSKLRSDSEKGASSVLLSTRFDLPRRLSLVTSVETDANAHKASLAVVVPLEVR